MGGRNGRVVARTGAALALVLGAVACGGGDGADGDTGGSPPVPTTPTTPAAPPESGAGYTITYTSATTRIPDAIASQAVLSVDTAEQRYRFDAATLEGAGVTLSPGRVLLIPGVALRRIATVTTSGGVTTVTTSYAALTDAIRDANITWDAPLRYSAANLAGARLVVQDTTLAPSSMSATGAVEFTYSAGGNDIKATVTPSGTTATIEVEVTRKAGTRTAARFTARTVLGEMRSLARIDIANGRTNRFDYDAKGLGGTVDLDIAAAGAGTDELAFTWPEPMIRFPVQVGPLPVIVTIKAQVVTKLVVNANASAVAKTQLSFAGDAGFRYDGTSLSTTASAGLGNPSRGASSADAAALIGNAVDAQFGFAAPRVEVGIFGETIVPFIRPEFFVGSRLQWGPVCKSAYVKYLVQGGVDLRFLGSTLANRTDTISGPYEVRESQENCAGAVVQGDGGNPWLPEVAFGR